MKPDFQTCDDVKIHKGRQVPFEKATLLPDVRQNGSGSDRVRKELHQDGQCNHNQRKTPGIEGVVFVPRSWFNSNAMDIERES